MYREEKEQRDNNNNNNTHTHTHTQKKNSVDRKTHTTQHMCTQLKSEIKSHLAVILRTLDVNVLVLGLVKVFRINANVKHVGRGFR